MASAFGVLVGVLATLGLQRWRLWSAWARQSKRRSGAWLVEGGFSTPVGGARQLPPMMAEATIAREAGPPGLDRPDEEAAARPSAGCEACRADADEETEVLPGDGASYAGSRVGSRAASFAASLAAPIARSLALQYNETYSGLATHETHERAEPNMDRITERAAADAVPESRAAESQEGSSSGKGHPLEAGYESGEL